MATLPDKSHTLSVIVDSEEPVRKAPADVPRLLVKLSPVAFSVIDVELFSTAPPPPVETLLVATELLIVTVAGAAVVKLKTVPLLVETLLLKTQPRTKPTLSAMVDELLRTPPVLPD